ncbi:MAG: hypothetical protein MRECE_35c017 [Mycoplasmataceae bacterium CE_OT135]|nr:MAG: hypothetical protein MRECE_35c017 [Mycoplasmataceae bacterium CE_OT135]
MNKLIFTLSILNILLSLGIIFWALNKNCSRCQKEMSFKRIFSFKDKCEKCAGSDEPKPWWHFTGSQERSQT